MTKYSSFYSSNSNYTKRKKDNIYYVQPCAKHFHRPFSSQDWAAPSHTCQNDPNEWEWALLARYVYTYEEFVIVT